MARYIDAEPILKKFASIINESKKYTDYECGLDDAYYYVNTAPIADVQEVKHGNWVKPSELSAYVCDKCGKSPSTIFGITPNYCPNCGAKMDENG